MVVARRISPPLLIDLLEHTGRQVADLFGRLDPDAPAPFPVACAGELLSANWFDVGRESVEGDQTLGAGVFDTLAVMA